MQGEIDSKVNVIENTGEIEKGMTGMTCTALRPEGKALFNNKRVVVYSPGEFVDQDTEVIVTKITSDKIFVKPS